MGNMEFLENLILISKYNQKKERGKKKEKKKISNGREKVDFFLL